MNVGAVFVSVTETRNELVAVSRPSLTTVVNVLVDGACALVGVQLMTPLPLIDALVGASIRL